MRGLSTDGANLNLPGPSSRWHVRKGQVKVVIRGDFSFATFLCMAGKEKLSQIILTIYWPQSSQLLLQRRENSITTKIQL